VPGRQTHAGTREQRACCGAGRAAGLARRARGCGTVPAPPQKAESHPDGSRQLLPETQIRPVALRRGARFQRGSHRVGCVSTAPVSHCKDGQRLPSARRGGSWRPRSLRSRCCFELRFLFDCSLNRKKMNPGPGPLPNVICVKVRALV